MFITEGTCTLNTKVRFKPTNTHCLLHRHSFHPGNTFKGIIKGQLDRFYRLCSKEADFERSTHTLFKGLCEMSYYKRFLQRIKTEFRHNLIKRNTVERKPELPATTIIPLIYMHHVVSQEICRTLIQIYVLLGMIFLEIAN